MLYVTLWLMTLSAGKVHELTKLFEHEPILHASHPLNIALLNLQPRHVPNFYTTMVETLAIPPNASSVALLIRAFGRLHKPLQAEAVWKQWQV